MIDLLTKYEGRNMHNIFTTDSLFDSDKIYIKHLIHFKYSSKIKTQ
jgi:hypothetical protein